MEIALKGNQLFQRGHVIENVLDEVFIDSKFPVVLANAHQEKEIKLNELFSL